ncbi:hypothetical protein DL95DRAFT_308961, partial [Leptodontidium sp. 2 PMI_412]
RNILTNRFKIPSSFWSRLARDASGFVGSNVTQDASANLESYGLLFRFLIKEPHEPGQIIHNNSRADYVWHRLGFFTSWTPSCSTTFFCFDLPTGLQDSIKAALCRSGTELQLTDPFAVHTVLVDEIVALYDQALWSLREQVRNLEKNRSLPENPQPNYETMHDLARHTIHSSEMLSMALEIMSSLLREYEIVFEENRLLLEAAIPLFQQTRRKFRFQITLFKCLHFRSQALEERLRNEINLAFNIVAQHDSRISVRISEAAQIDSAAMRTISVLGLAFLPGTFICAIFSTSFFNFNPGSDSEPQAWRRSDKFWVLWAVTLPLTLATIIFWVYWERALSLAIRWLQYTWGKICPRR